MLGLKMKGENGLFTPPSYSHVYLLKTIAESNNLGEWFGWDITRVGPVEDVDTYHAAKAFAESVSKGEVKVKYEEESSTGEQKVPF